MSAQTHGSTIIESGAKPIAASVPVDALAAFEKSVRDDPVRGLAVDYFLKKLTSYDPANPEFLDKMVDADWQIFRKGWLAHAAAAAASKHAAGEEVTWLTRCKSDGTFEEADPHEKARDNCWTDAFPVYAEPDKRGVAALEALTRLCTHEKRTNQQINRDWDYARAVLAGADVKAVADTHTRDQALEDAACICDKNDGPHRMVAGVCADEIRALKSKSTSAACA